MSIDDQRYAALTLQSLRVTIGPYRHAMLIGGKPERIEIFIVSGLSLSRPVDTKADLKLSNIIASPSSNLILTPLDECQSW